MSQNNNQFTFTNQEDIRYQIIVDLISLAAGLDLAVSSIKDGEISQRASEELRQLIFQSYAIIANKIAFSILQAHELIPSEDNFTQYNIILDTPDQTHDDIIIRYTAKSTA